MNNNINIIYYFVAICFLVSIISRIKKKPKQCKINQYSTATQEINKLISIFSLQMTSTNKSKP